MSNEYIEPHEIVSPKDRWELEEVLHAGEADSNAFAVGLWDGVRKIVCRCNGMKGSPNGYPQAGGHPTWMLLDHRPGLAAVLAYLDDAQIEDMVLTLG